MPLGKFDLTGKVALITGGAGLLGSEHCAALLESGAQVIICDIDNDRLLEVRQRLGKRFRLSKIRLQSMDVTSEESILSAQNFLKLEGIRVDILVNNAAIDPKVNDKITNLPTSRLENFSLNSWDHQIAVGLTGAFLCSKIFGAAMASDAKGGVILNIASDLSVLSPYQRLYSVDGLQRDQQPVKPITYSVIKSGLVGLTKYLATYWADENIRCNALSPGGVFNGQDELFVQRLKELIPLGRMAKHDEYRSAIQFLCSDASAYMNGQNILMDGGRSAW